MIIVLTLKQGSNRPRSVWLGSVVIIAAYATRLAFHLAKLVEKLADY